MLLLFSTPSLLVPKTLTLTHVIYFFNIDSSTGFSLHFLDHFTTRPDNCSNEFSFDEHLHHSWCMWFHFASCFGHTIVHCIQGYAIVPRRACSNACDITSIFKPSTFISICTPQIPSRVPVTLKSISPRWSSSPRISRQDRIFIIFCDQSHRNSTHVFWNGTPESINANEPAQTVAMDEEPFDSKDITHNTYCVSEIRRLASFVSMNALQGFHVQLLFCPVLSSSLLHQLRKEENYSVRINFESIRFSCTFYQ